MYGKTSNVRQHIAKVNIIEFSSTLKFILRFFIKQKKYSQAKKPAKWPLSSMGYQNQEQITIWYNTYELGTQK